MQGDSTQTLRRENEDRRDELFAQIAVEQGVLTAKQAEEIRLAQQALQGQGFRRPLRSLCVERGLMDEAQALLIRQEMRRRGWRPLVGKYEIIRRIGTGGMGTVFLARNMSIGKTVALKMLPARLARDAAFVRRFDREARLAARISHANVVQVLDADEADGRRFLVMEYVEGESLRDRLRRGGPLEEAEAVGLLRQVASGLAVAHAAGIVHRDIKPANILLDRNGVPKVADLGVARSLDPGETTLTSADFPLGTPLYMAPEQAGGARAADARSDIYSLGATFYHALAGSPPFEGETLYEILRKHIESPAAPLNERRPDLSPGLCAIVGKMMAREPEGRYPSCEALIADLDDLLSGTHPAAYADMMATRRVRMTAALAAAGGLVLLLTGLAFGWRMFMGRQPAAVVPPAAPQDVGDRESLPRPERRGDQPVLRPATADEWGPALARYAVEEAIRNPFFASGAMRDGTVQALRRFLDSPGDPQAAREAANVLESLSQEGHLLARASALNALAAVRRQTGEEDKARAARAEAMRLALEGLLRYPGIDWSGENARVRGAVEAFLREPTSREAAYAAAEALDRMAATMERGGAAYRYVAFGAAAAHYLAGDPQPWLRFALRGRRDAPRPGQAERPTGRGRQEREGRQ